MVKRIMWLMVLAVLAGCLLAGFPACAQDNAAPGLLAWEGATVGMAYAFDSKEMLGMAKVSANLGHWKWNEVTFNGTLDIVAVAEDIASIADYNVGPGLSLNIGDTSKTLSFGMSYVPKYGFVGSMAILKF